MVSLQCAAQGIGIANQLFGLLIQTILAAHCNISPANMWPPDYGSKAVKNGTEIFDFIIVGAGSAGSVLANRLSENKNWSVLLLEAGGDPPIETELPGVVLTNVKTVLDWGFHAELDSTCLAQKNGCIWPRGKVLGGSSAVNAMVYIRGNHRDYDRWEKMVDSTWGWSNALKYFKKSEGNHNTAFVDYENGKYHNDSGLQVVDSFGKLDPNARIFYEAGAELGMQLIDDINADVHLGFVEAQGTISKGRRYSTAKSYLVPAKNRTNLKIIKHAHVEKILIDRQKRAVGVEFFYNGKHKMKVQTRKEVILSAGAVSSPQLLMLSGVGPAEHLLKHKINVKMNLPVGKNLLDHVCTVMFFRFHRSSAIQQPPTHLLDAIYNLSVYNSGVLAGFGLTPLLAFIDTKNETAYPDIELHFMWLPRGGFEAEPTLHALDYSEDVTNAIKNENAKEDMVAIFVTLLQPKSTGFIELKSSSPYDKPRIVPNYLRDDEDMKTMLRAVKQQLSFEDTESYRKHEGEFAHIPIKECDRFEFRSDNYLRCYIKYFSATLYHPVGTSKMGLKSNKDAVVDPTLKVQGIKGLRQIDAGVMPYLLSGNINAPTIMVAEHGADLIKEEYSKLPKGKL